MITDAVWCHILTAFVELVINSLYHSRRSTRDRQYTCNCTDTDNMCKFLAFISVAAVLFDILLYSINSVFAIRQFIY